MDEDFGCIEIPDSVLNDMNNASDTAEKARIMDDFISGLNSWVPKSKEDVRSSMLGVGRILGQDIDTFDCKECGLEELNCQNFDGLCRDCRPWCTRTDYEYVVSLEEYMRELSERQLFSGFYLTDDEQPFPDTWLHILDKFKEKGKPIIPFQVELDSNWCGELIEALLTECRVLTDKDRIYVFYQETASDGPHRPYLEWVEATSLSVNTSMVEIQQVIEALWDDELIGVSSFSNESGRVY